MKKALMPSLQMADQSVLTLANTVVAALTGNAYFTTPSPTLASVETAISGYSASLSKSKYGSREDKAQKNADKATLLGLLRDLCIYVNMIAKGDAVVLSTCGYPLSKDAQPSVLGTPDAKVENGASGELISSTPAVDGAVSYKHQYTTDPASALWPEVTTTRATCKIDGLEPGKLYSLRIVAIGTNDQVTMSDVVTKMVA
jgi:hypothetical protein